MQFPACTSHAIEDSHVFHAALASLGMFSAVSPHTCKFDPFWWGTDRRALLFGALKRREIVMD